MKFRVTSFTAVLLLLALSAGGTNLSSAAQIIDGEKPPSYVRIDDTRFDVFAPLGGEQISDRLEEEGCVTLSEKKVKICKADYLSDGNSIEAVSIRPLGEGKYPGILLTSGFVTLATTFAQQGFACLSIE
ncbi:MAG: hypothetical protein ACREBC_13560, partial [Pyrinomonadaceae bacterium]